MPKEVLIQGEDISGNIKTIKVNADNRKQEVESVITGDIAHDVVDKGNPVKIGAKASNANPTAVANADRVNIFADLKGRLVVLLNQVRELVTSGKINIDKETEIVVLAGVASTFHDCVLVQGSNNSTGAFRVDFRDVAAGAVKFSIHLAAGAVETISFNTPFPQTTVNTDWTAQIVDDAGVTDLSNADVDIMIQAVK